jgi:hypothetical protein
VGHLIQLDIDTASLRPGVDLVKVRGDHLAVPHGTVGVFQGVSQGILACVLFPFYGTHELADTDLTEPYHLHTRLIGEMDFLLQYTGGAEAFWDHGRLGLGEEDRPFAQGFADAKAGTVRGQICSFNNYVRSVWRKLDALEEATA